MGKKENGLGVIFELVRVCVNKETNMKTAANVTIKIAGMPSTSVGFGSEPTEAVFKTIAKIAGVNFSDFDFSINRADGRMKMLFEVAVWPAENGNSAVGRAVDPDVNIATAKAFISSLNQLECEKMVGG